MKSLVLKHDSHHKGDILNTDYQIAFSDWKQGNQLPIGTWGLNLVGPGNLKLKLGEINYLTSDIKNKNWVTIPTLEWIDVPMDGILQFKLMLDKIKIRNTVFTSLVPYYPENWFFKIYVKTKDESGEGLREDAEINPTVEFCSRSITTKGKNKILAAKCPYDPDTGKSMEKCLNWRRIDQVGSACYKIMDMEVKKDSIREFCVKDPCLADCKCINRLHYQEYLQLKNLRGDNDYCWYTPCKSGAYLLEKEGQSEKCNGNYCIITYNNKNVGGDVNFTGNVTSCYNMESPIGKDSSKKRS